MAKGKQDKQQVERAKLPKPSNDQIGENASEEYSNELYANASKAKSDKKK
ncbi:MAG: hypothetical protein N3B21_03770 [Clostridia bacterium]|nr:hypothetical protein [Clostridia bacterium]